jgi:negative regulator of sigma E activity
VRQTAGAMAGKYPRVARLTYPPGRTQNVEQLSDDQIKVGAMGLDIPLRAIIVVNGIRREVVRKDNELRRLEGGMPGEMEAEVVITHRRVT